MKCPKCKKEMEKGYLQSGRQILFSPVKKKLNPSRYSKKTDTRITSFFDYAVDAYICKDCKEVVFNYKDL